MPRDLPPEWRLESLRDNPPERCHRKIVTPKYAEDSIAAMLQGCTGREKAIYLCKRVAKMSNREIGTAFGISHVHAIRLYRNALRKSRGYLKE